MDRIEHDFYSIEEHGGSKFIHVFGYAYDSDDGSETPYRLVEFCFNYIPVGLAEDEFDKEYECYNGDRILCNIF